VRNIKELGYSDGESQYVVGSLKAGRIERFRGPKKDAWEFAMAHRKKRAEIVEHIPRAKLIVTISRLLNAMLGSTSNMLVTLEDIKQIFPKLRIDIVDDDDLPNEEARAYPNRWRIKIRKGMNEGLLRGDARARWSLAHELAHIFLQHPRWSLSRPRQGDSKEPYELEANLFAATFLAPYELAKSRKTIEEIRDQFQISSGAAVSRLKELQREERRRKMALERGLAPETFSIEAGSR
jgi:IrrE N-terminal-like domain